jgi:glycerol-3-phosphate dehydrogenase (NAD(P)+)
MKIAVLSDGGWGTALALVLCGNGHEVRIWGPFPDYLAEMAATRKNPRFLAGVTLPDALTVEADLAKAADGCDILVLASPTQYMRGLLTKLQALQIPQETILVSVAKGIEVATLKRISEIVGEMLGGARFAVLSGPSHAEEVARGIPTAVVVASADNAAAETVRDAFMNPVFRVYTSGDVVGVELGGALKNVLALAAGVCDGMGFGDNTKAALMTRGVMELARFGKALGGRPETFFGLSGIGDLIVTCTSRHSRNRHVGEELGKGRKLPDIQKEMGLVVAEGVPTTESAFRLAQKAGIEVPIIAEVHAGLYEGKDPRQALRDLMTRQAKPEHPEDLLA